MQKKKLVAKRLRKAFWTENWPITTRGTTEPASWKGGGMDKSIPEGCYLYFILLYKQNDPKPPSQVGWWDLSVGPESEGKHEQTKARTRTRMMTRPRTTATTGTETKMKRKTKNEDENDGADGDDEEDDRENEDGR